MKERNGVPAEALKYLDRIGKVVAQTQKLRKRAMRIVQDLQNNYRETAKGRSAHGAKV